MDETLEKIWHILMPDAARRVIQARQRGTRFAHYTSAEGGMAILRSGRMLLRNSILMNDFSEVRHGMDCLSRSYRGPIGDRLKEAIRKVQADLPEILEANFDQQIVDVQSETYLISISEHGDPDQGDELEDSFGRLSMWRAYANRNGVAFVFNNAPFLAENDAIRAYSSPVIYATADAFDAHFEQVTAGIEANLELFQPFGGKFLHDELMRCFRFASQSTKHPSFREEREWRVIYTPTILQRDGLLTPDQLDRVPTEIMTLKGTPQRVYAIPFRNHPDEGFVGATIPELIDRVLIGPSPDAYPIAQAFVAELTAQGVPDADRKVVITGVPLRV